jgi:hypothetical protein
MFEVLTKINIIITLIKFLKEYRFFSLIFFLFLISTLVFVIGFLKYNDNSIHIDNIDQVPFLSIDDLCDELDHYISLDSKNMQYLYIIKVLSNQITERLKNHAKH